MLKRILDKQLELNEYEPYGGGVSHDQNNKKSSFIEELRYTSKRYVSPKTKNIKDILKRKAEEGKTSWEFDKYIELDDFTILWLKEEGFDVTEQWRGSMEDGSTYVKVTW